MKSFWKAILIPVFILLLWVAPGWTIETFAQNLPGSVRPFMLSLGQSAQNRPDLDPSNISSEKVSQFVHACLQVVALIERREGELQGAETETESLRIEQEIEAEALAIIEQAGLTHQEYLQLLGLANTDPEFGERIAVLLQEAAG